MQWRGYFSLSLDWSTEIRAFIKMILFCGHTHTLKTLLAFYFLSVWVLWGGCGLEHQTGKNVCFDLR